MICPECGKTFSPKAVNQKYCSDLCGQSFRRKHPETVRFPPVSFRCAKCGKAVVTDGKHDKRTRFCSENCEKRYWKHPPKNSSLTNFNSRFLEWYEKQE